MKLHLAKTMVALVAPILMICGCVNGKSVMKSVGDRVEKQLSIAEFSSIENKGNIDIVYTRGAVKAKLTAPENILPLIKINVNNGKLTVEIDDNYLYQLKEAPRLEVSSTTLTNVSNAGSGNIYMADINADELNIGLLGSGDLIFDKGEANKIYITTRGSGDADVKNIVSNFLILNTSGSGDICIDEYKGTGVQADSKGSGDIMLKNLHISDLSLATLGSGDAYVSGECKDAKISSMGSGDVDIRKLKYDKILSDIKGSGELIK